MEEERHDKGLYEFLHKNLGQEITLVFLGFAAQGTLVQFDKHSIGLEDVNIIYPGDTTVTLPAISLMAEQVTGFGKSVEELIIRDTAGGKASLMGMNYGGNITAMLSIMNGEQSNDYDSVANYSLSLNTVRAEGFHKTVDLTSVWPVAELSEWEKQSIAADNFLREQELRLQSAAAASALAATLAVLPVNVGTQLQFWINDTQTHQVQITATCVNISQHAYFFVQDGVPRGLLTDTVIQNFADVWDSNIYPKDREVFGNDRDTDGYGKLFILFTPLISQWGAIGMFNGVDKLPESITWPQYGIHSNEKDMFYMAFPQSANEIEYEKGTLAHEFQHMINWDAHTGSTTREWVWLNEAFSQVAKFITGFGSSINPLMQGFLALPISLTCWGGLSSQGRNYGGVALFGCYLYEQFGKKAIKKMVANVQNNGIKNIEQVTGLEFRTIYNNWIAALCLSNTGLTTDSRYNFSLVNLRANGFNGLKVLDTLEIGNDVIYTKAKPYQPIRTLLTNPASKSSITVASDADGAAAVIILSKTV